MMQSYLPILKADGDQRLVLGIASTPQPDDQGGEWGGERYDADIVTPEAMRAALADYWGNVREMHGAHAVGVAVDATVGDDGTTYLVARVEDAAAWAKVKAGVYKGLSIGGRVLAAALRRLADGRVARVITALRLSEISLVDRPANPGAAILLYKRGGRMSDETTEALAELAATVAKAAPDPTKIVTLVQALRNEAELGGDLEAAARYSQAIGLLLVGAGEAEAEPETDAAEDEAAEDVAEAEAVEMAAAPGEAAIAAAARAETTKAGRKIASARMAALKGALMTYAKVLADAGDPDAAAMLKAVGGGEMPDAKALGAEVEKALKAPIETVARAVLALSERVERIEREPAQGGPLRNLAAVRKAESAAPARPRADDATITRLRQLAATETHPARRAQYLEQLKALAN